MFQLKKKSFKVIPKNYFFFFNENADNFKNSILVSLKIKVMLRQSDDIVIPSLASIKKLLDPLYQRLDKIDTKLSHETAPAQKSKGYYRNKDLKDLFGFSNNTIIKYREQGVLPYTKIGDVFLYEIEVIDAILVSNKTPQR
jgi:hypothetical protein